MFKVNNKNTRTTSLTLFGVFIVNFEHISRFFSSVSIVDSEQENATNIHLFKVNNRKTRIGSEMCLKLKTKTL